MITPEDLRLVPEFADLADDDLAWLADQFDEVIMAPGEEPFESGGEALHMIVVFSGTMKLYLPSGAGWRLSDTYHQGAITGLLPYSRMTHFGGRAEVLEGTRFGRMHKDLFPDMLYRLPILGQRLVGLMSDRVRNSAKADQSREKMLALGKLSAGLAHELNNPAAAVSRATSDLSERLDALPAIVARLAAHGLDPDRIQPAARACTLHPATETVHTSALDLSDAEDTLLDWLEDQDIPDAWRLAPTLAESGMTVDMLEHAVGSVPAPAVPDVVAWIEQSLAASRLLKELNNASARISDLIGSVKAYSHMDRSESMQPVLLAEGIRNTVTMLGHKLRKNAIEVTLDLPDDLPAIQAHAGELNQVWTNLMDNAIDAMPEGGTLSISARPTGHLVVVSVADTGSGIPADVLPHIFEPFYTTKEVGEGTGLGLDIVHRIVIKQHAGDISVDSDASGSTFHVHLPRGNS